MAYRKKVCIFLFMVAVAATKPAEDDKKSRVLDHKLSDEEHFAHDEHNPDYDHDAFLGEDQADYYDTLPPEESKRRLGLIIEKVDSDGDGLVTKAELKQWIDYTQKRYLMDDTKRQWETHNPKNKDQVSWDEYRSLVYGFMDNIDPTELDDEKEADTYKKMIARDERRWKLADRDADGALTLAEFTDFLHPEESEHMKDIVITETMEDMDLDSDGKISLEEYIGDLYKGEEDESEPNWVEAEREQFAQYRDKDKDGFMHQEEVKSWITPPDYDHSSAEATHLVKEADGDGDGVLTKDEILENYDVFVGSQVTDFGEALNRHDEF